MVFIRNRNEKLFCEVIKEELLYLWRHSYRNSSKTFNSKLTLTLHLNKLIFVQVLLVKTTLVKGSKSKSKKIIVQGNLNSSFAFVLKRIFRLIHASIFRKCLKNIWTTNIWLQGNIHMHVQSFWAFLIKNHVRFYEKHLRRCQETSFKHNIVVPNDNFLEQEFENFNRDKVGNEEPLGDDRNGEEEE